MKKTFKIFSIATATVMALAMYSCTDFLTIYPTDKVVLEDFWKDKADVDGMVANSYKNLVSDDFVKRVFVYGELRSDDVVETTNIGTELKYINNANLLATNGYCNWSIYYKITVINLLTTGMLYLRALYNPTIVETLKFMIPRLDGSSPGLSLMPVAFLIISTSHPCG